MLNSNTPDLTTFNPELTSIPYRYKTKKDANASSLYYRNKSFISTFKALAIFKRLFTVGFV